MRTSGIKTEEDRNNEVYHDTKNLFLLYRSVNWRMQIKVNQIRGRIRAEYGMEVDKFLDSVYQAGMDINQDLDDMAERIEAINRSNKFLKLLDEAVELMRKYHPQGEKYYWVLYYSYMSAYRADNVKEILEKLEAHFPRIQRSTYFRWRDQAFEAVSGILWGYEEESKKIFSYFSEMERNTVDLENTKNL